MGYYKNLQYHKASEELLLSLKEKHPFLYSPLDVENISVKEAINNSLQKGLILDKLIKEETDKENKDKEEFLNNLYKTTITSPRTGRKIKLTRKLLLKNKELRDKYLPDEEMEI